jgi:hypothetical protein
MDWGKVYCANQGEQVLIWSNGSFEFNLLLLTGPEQLRVSAVQIDYNDISLDIGMVVEYISRQVLSLDSVK